MQRSWFGPDDFVGFAGCGGFDGFDGFRWLSMAPMASRATVVPEAVGALLAPKLNVGTPQPRLQLAATPRESDGSSSLRTGGQNWWNAS